MSSLATLPTYIITIIFHHLTDISTYLILAATCKRFKTILNSYSTITSQQITQFQSAQRQLYQALSFSNPRRNEWVLDGKMNLVCDIMQKTLPKAMSIRQSGLIKFMFVQLQKPKEEWDLALKCFHEYLILGRDRIAQIYDDVMYKLANSRFVLLNLSHNKRLYKHWDYFFTVIRRNPHNIKLQHLSLRSTKLTDLGRLYDIQDLFDNCTLHLPKDTCYSTYQGVITGVALVFIQDDRSDKGKLQSIFRDNDGNPAIIW